MPRTRAGQQHRKGKPNGAGDLAVFDLGAHRLAERFDVKIVGPDGEPTPMVVTLASRYSKEYRTRKSASDRAFRETPEAQEVVTAEEGGVVMLLHIVAAQTVAITGAVLDGSLSDFSPEAMRALYTSPGLGWLYEQVADASATRERFLPNPSNAS